MWLPFDPTIKDNPYPYYQEQANINPRFTTKSGISYILDYKGAKQVLSNTDLFISETPALPSSVNISHFEKLMNHCMIVEEGEDHEQDRMRSGAAFNMHKLDERIQQMTSNLLEKATGQDEFDLITDVALPLANTILCEILGFTKEGKAAAPGWSESLIQTLDWFNGSEAYRDIERNAEELSIYLNALIQNKQFGKSESFIALSLKHLRPHGDDQFVRDYIFSLVFTLLITGIFTIVGAAGNATLALTRNPKQREYFRRLPDRQFNAAVEELLRYDSPLQFVFRKTTDDGKLGELAFKKNQTIAVGLAAANRDEKKFSSPNKIEFTRSPNPHLTFGFGIHYCFGAKLARMQVRSLLKHLFRGPETYELVRDTIAYKPVRFVKVPASIILMRSDRRKHTNL